MRKAFIGILMAATAVTPVAAASAQEREYSRGWEREEAAPMQVAQRERGERSERRSSRSEAPAAVPQQSREQVRGGWQRQAQPAPQPAPQAAPQRQTERGGWQSQTDANWQGNRNDPRHERARERYNRNEQQAATQNQRQAEMQRQAALQRQAQVEAQRRGGYDRRDVRNQWQAQQRADRRSHQRWDRGWWNDRRYNWYDYRYANRHLFRMPTYYAPYRGHRYSRFSIGFHIGMPLFHQRYWISDPWRYRLPQPYPGYQWIRYYDDVLLIDTWTGEVVDVIYDFFW